MTLKERPDLDQESKGYKKYAQFENLLKEVSQKEISTNAAEVFNAAIAEINAFSGSEREQKKKIAKTQSKLLTHLEKEHKIVTKNHYRNMWLAVGMGAFGIPLGAAFGASIGNMGMIALGLPIGMVIGIAVGTNMDKKALKEGRQLDIEIKM